MSYEPIAQVRILDQTSVRPATVRVEVQCERRVTGLTQKPGPLLALTAAQLVTIAVFEHEVHCGECDTTWAHARGDRRAREMTDRAWEQFLTALSRRRAESMGR